MGIKAFECYIDGPAGKKAQRKGTTFLGIQIDVAMTQKDWMKIMNLGYGYKTYQIL